MELTRAKRRVIDRLKRVDSATVAELAADLELTEMAVRLHLGALEAEGLIAKRAPASDNEPGQEGVRGKGRARGRGRPAVSWRLTAAADGLFDDRHADLTVDLIATVRKTLGADALQKVIDTRGASQIAAYSQQVGEGPVGERVRALAEIRTREGYQAEVRAEDDGVWLLIEHHCPICSAAKACSGLCASELDVFRAVLGNDVTIERTQHLLQDGRRCVYRITPSSC